MTDVREEAYEARNEGAPARLLFFCDHASNRVPQGLGTLGLSRDELSRHIAYDIGAAALTCELAHRFNAPAILARWSRLVVDLNRGADDPTVVMKLSDGQIISGNRDLDADGIAERIRLYHTPYHAALSERVARERGQGRVPVLVSIHSFTPVWRGSARPWQVGVLWDRDGRLAKPLMAALAADGIATGDNEPYSGALENDSLYRHGSMNGLPHVLIEVRQDLIADASGIVSWAERLERALRLALERMGPPAILFTRPLPFPGGPAMDEKTRTELEAAAFRHLVAHLRNRTDVQNIDLMNLAGFCRNCLGDWYREAASERGIALEKDQAREIVYGMPPAEWKRRYQKESTPEQQAAFQKAAPKHG